jgi:hypothetical protein
MPLPKEIKKKHNETQDELFFSSAFSYNNHQNLRLEIDDMLNNPKIHEVKSFHKKQFKEKDPDEPSMPLIHKKVDVTEHPEFKTVSKNKPEKKQFIFDDEELFEIKHPKNLKKSYKPKTKHKPSKQKKFSYQMPKIKFSRGEKKILSKQTPKVTIPNDFLKTKFKEYIPEEKNKSVTHDNKIKNVIDMNQDEEYDSIKNKKEEKTQKPNTETQQPQQQPQQKTTPTKEKKIEEPKQPLPHFNLINKIPILRKN